MEEAISEFNFQEMCRTCLKIKDSEALTSAFDIYCNENSFTDVLNTFTGIKIDPMDSLPQQVCSGCISKLITGYDFKVQAQESEARLKIIMESMEFKLVSPDNPDDELHGLLIRDELVVNDHDYIVIHSDEETVTEEVSLEELPSKESTAAKRTFDEVLDDSGDLVKHIFVKDVYSLSAPSNTEAEQNEKRKLNDSNESTVEPELESEVPETIEKYDEATLGKENMEKGYSEGRVLRSSFEFKDFGKPNTRSKSSKGEKLYGCELCKKKFKSEAEVGNHKETAHKDLIEEENEDPLPNDKSPTPDKILKTPVALKPPQEQSRSQSQETEPFKCKLCEQTFKRRHLLNSHLIEHTIEASEGIKPSFECAECGKSYIHKSSLDLHEKEVHLGVPRRKRIRPKNKTCSVCNKKFYDLKAHMRSHTKEKPFECDICKARVGTRFGLKCHMNTHAQEKPYKCETCGKGFNTRSLLNMHAEIHAGQSYPCEICGKTFSLKKNLYCHTLTHETGARYECATCGKVYSKQASLADHRRRVHSDKPRKPRVYSKNHTCQICGKNFFSGTLKIHMRTHTQEKPFECAICHSRSVTKGALKIHMYTHSDERPYKCDVCEKGFIQKAQLKSHYRTHTGESLTVLCSYCGADFRWPQTLKTHIRREHPERLDKEEREKAEKERSFVCEICGYASTSAHALSKHMAVHSDNRYFCKICGKSSKYKRSIQSHELEHSESGSFECVVCSKRFHLAYRLKSHMANHSGEKPHECTICQKGFSEKYNLNKHMKMHSGEKPLVCSICFKVFTDKQKYKVHMLWHAGVKPHMCEFCDKGFVEIADLEKHAKVHQKVKVTASVASEVMMDKEVNRSPVEST